MSSPLNRLYLPKRTLLLACFFAGLVAALQGSMLFFVTGTLASALKLEGSFADRSGAMGRTMISLMAISSAMGAWAFMASTVVQNRGTKGFLGQLPVSGKQIHQTRLRSDLIAILLPLSIALVLFALAGLYRGVALEVGRVGLDLFGGILLGLAIFEKPLIGKPVNQKRKVFGLMLGFMPIFLIIAFDSILLTFACGGVGLWLLRQSWSSKTKSVLLMPKSLECLDEQSVNENFKNGNKILNQWILRHTLFQKNILFIGLVVSLYMFGNMNSFDSPKVGNSIMTFYFLGILVFMAALVTKKLESYPIPKNKLFHFIVLPSLGFLATGFVLAELLSMSGLVEDEPNGREEIPISFTFDSSLIGDGSVQQLIVPARMLKLTNADVPPLVQGPDGEHYLAPTIPILWQGGPSLFSPYYVPEGESGEFDATLLSFQLERALTEFYGESLSANEIESRFTQSYKNGNVYFQSEEFIAWQSEWAASHAENFTSERDWWHSQALNFLPARVLGWLLGWACAVAMAFWMRLPTANRKRKRISSCAWLSAFLVAFFFQVGGMGLFRGFVHADGFTQRMNILPAEILRNYMPDNTVLAWLVIIPIFLFVYRGLLEMYKKTEWADLRPQNGQAQGRYEAWKKL